MNEAFENDFLEDTMSELCEDYDFWEDDDYTEEEENLLEGDNSIW